ncbi:MAG: alpha/beta hydrolase fold protein, partial [Solirubrobacterales bacterium]|nr:alpha/beta hydrolase fold protein [Solirubrobacterales bacterium]
MRPSKLLSLAAGTLLACAAAPAAAAAAPTFTPCPNDVGVQCTTVPVPLDRSGGVPGNVVLHVARVPASRGAAQGTLVILTGGPGQSSIPLVSDLRDVFHTVLEHYDLVVFDSRGTGSSGVIDCPDLQSSAARDGLACAGKLGAARAFYTTRDSVADLDAVRTALGIPKISLYGVSYGTKVARAYALTYPGTVERLILDSAVPAAGPDVFIRSTFAALPRVLAHVCESNACRGVTASPLVDLTKLVGRLTSASLHGAVFDGRGHRHSATLTQPRVLEALLASDVSPGLRATLPAAIHSAAGGDPAPLLRILSGGRSGGESLTDLSEGLFAATTCEESAFPWARTSAPPERQAAVNATLAGLPPSTYAPFDAATALGESNIPLCISWPQAPAEPAIPLGPISGIPTLIFSGQEDLRTPLEDAQGVQAGIASSQLVQVADTGHSVLGTALDTCPATQLEAFFRGAPTTSCLSHSGAIGVAPLAPHSLASAGTARGVHGARGHVVAAVGETLDDASDAFVAAVLSNRVIRFGGLRGGWGRADGSSLALHDFAFVPGVKVSGKLRLASRGLTGNLRVTAPNGLGGTLHPLPRGVLAGTLGGRGVRD